MKTRTGPAIYEGAEYLRSNVKFDEFKTKIGKIRDSAPGIGGIRTVAIKVLDSEGKIKFYESVFELLRGKPDDWPPAVKKEWTILLNQNCSKADLNNYRGVCLLPLASGLIARIFKTRLRKWTETTEALGENKGGFEEVEIH